jgi:UDP-glucuronate 4-epimerase
MKILVTGSAGFIGFHLTKALLERGDEVVGLDNINDYYDVELKHARLYELGIEPKENKETLSIRYPKHRFIYAHLEDDVLLSEVFRQERFDGVCHLAAQAGVRYSLENPKAYIQSNIVGFLNILEACRHYGVQNLCYASSSSVYGLNESQPFCTHHHTDHPLSLYAATKKSNEMMAHTYSHLYGIATTGLRFFTVYGPWGRPDMAPMLFADALRHDRAIEVFNHGKMSRDFTYIDDIVSGILKVIDHPAIASSHFDAHHPNPSISLAPYRLYNIGNNAPVNLMEFIETLEKAMGKEAKKNFMDIQAGDVESTYADTSGLIEDFDYAPHTPLHKGIGEFVTWYEAYCKKI